MLFVVQEVCRRCHAGAGPDRETIEMKKKEEPEIQGELVEPELEDSQGGIDTVPLPDRVRGRVRIGTWPTPERPVRHDLEGL